MSEELQDPSLPPNNSIPPPKDSPWRFAPVLLLILFAFFYLLFSTKEDPNQTYIQTYGDQVNSDSAYPGNPSANKPDFPEIPIIQSSGKSAPPLSAPNHQNKQKESPEQIYEETDSVVRILGLDKSNETLITGSGVIVPSKKYGFCVMTASHLFLPMPIYPANIPPDNPYGIILPSGYEMPVSFKAYFKYEENPQPLEIIGRMANYDIVILKFKNPEFKPKQIAVLGRSALLKPGSRVMAIGSSLVGNFSLSTGQAYLKPGPANPYLQKHLKSRDKIANYWPTMILTSTPVFYGYSGGPMFNEYGELVGITVGFVDSNVSIGLPIDDLLPSLSDLIP